MLVRDEPPVRSDVIVVLGGDYRGDRIDRAIELIRGGYARKMLISGPAAIFGTRESILAARYAVEKGLSPDQAIPLNRNDASTSDEARTITPLLRSMGVHSYLLVTSPSHTGRAYRVFHRQAPELIVRSVASRDPLWCGGYWWTNRECRKTWLLEELKTLADFFRL
jgi:uncharacterized SAM-binding protein YcdF (DUF218 family)